MDYRYSYGASYKYPGPQVVSESDPGMWTQPRRGVAPGRPLALATRPGVLGSRISLNPQSFRQYCDDHDDDDDDDDDYN